MSAVYKPRFTVSVPTGGDAVMTIVNPMADPHIEWSLRYESDLASWVGRFSAAAVVESYDYLLSHHINLKEAVRRLRLLRAARLTAIAQAKKGAAPEGIAPLPTASLAAARAFGAGLDSDSLEQPSEVL